MFRLPLKQNISNTGLGPGGWQRPGDWLPLPEVPEGKQGANCLISIHEGLQTRFGLLVVLAEGTTGVVDWGDGTIEEFQGYAYISHLYNYPDFEGTECVRGYRQCVVKIGIKEATGKILQFSTTQPDYNTQDAIPLLDLQIRAEYLDTFLNVVGVVAMPRYLERINFPGANNLSQVSFSQARSLRLIENMTFHKVTTLYRGFYGCGDVRFINASFDTPNIVNFSSCFSDSALQEIPPLDLNLADDLNNFLGNSSYSKPIRRMRAHNVAVDLNIAYSCLNSAALQEVFTNLKDLTGLTAKTITITNSLGVRDLTQAQRDIALNKNWTIVE